VRLIRQPVSSVLKVIHWYNIESYVKAYLTTCIQCFAGPTLIQYWIVCDAYQTICIQCLKGSTLIQYWIICEGLSDYMDPVFCRAHAHTILNHMWGLSDIRFHITEKNTSIIKSTKLKFRLKKYILSRNLWWRLFSLKEDQFNRK